MMHRPSLPAAWPLALPVLAALGGCGGGPDAASLLLSISRVPEESARITVTLMNQGGPPATATFERPAYDPEPPPMPMGGTPPMGTRSYMLGVKLSGNISSTLRIRATAHRYDPMQRSYLPQAAGCASPAISRSEVNRVSIQMGMRDMALPDCPIQ
jgi:hypothetical protein